MLDVCTFFSARLYTCACTYQVCGCCIDACIFIKCLESSFRILFSSGTLFECRACSNVKKEETRRRVCFLHISPCRMNSMVLRPATYRTIHLGTKAFGKLMYSFFTILLFYLTN
uniref:Uncharacterized protein n=1 Tax=Apis mellifera ligustica TaxID=7469 RepID=A0A6C0NGS8_APILI|nr:hypothetical protein [Apis mellifera ligustica]